MQLLRPAAFGVEAAEEEHQERGVFRPLLGRGGRAGARLGEDRGGLALGAVLGGNVLHAVVGQAAAQRVEEVVPLLERGEQAGEILHLDVGAGGELVAPGVEGGGLVDQERLVRPEGRINAGGQLGFPDRLMVRQVVDGIVGRADDGHLELGEDAVHGKRGLLQFRVGQLPDFRGVLFVDQQIDAEIAAQLEVRPVVQRVAQRLRHGPRVGEKLVVIARGVPGDEVLRHAVGPHRPPLVMIAGQPDLIEILEAAVGGDLVGRQVAVVIEDGLVDGMLKVERAGPAGREQEIVGQERSGGGHGGAVDHATRLGLEVIKADSEGVERIVRTRVLFNNEPLAAGPLGLGDDALEGQRAPADLAEGGLALPGDGVVLEMDERQAPAEFPAPFHAVAAAIMDPVGVKLADQIPRIGVRVNIVEHRRVPGT